MSPFRLIQISDTHLSRAKPHFVANYEAVVAHVNQSAPDIVLNTGDIALNGPDEIDDLAFAAEQHALFTVPVRTIPGNHDVGDNPADPAHPPKQLVTRSRLQAYEEYFGAGHWSVEAGAWRLIGFNAQLLGTGLPQEKAQRDFLEEFFSYNSAAPIAVFLHKPLFRDAPKDTSEAMHRYVTPGQRNRLLNLMACAPVKLVACGHVHQYRTFSHGEVQHVWCPSTAFILPDDLQPTIGEKKVGFVSYDFNGESVTVSYARAEGMTDTLITDVPAYGNIREKMRAASMEIAAA